jgi:hypothetical protein
VGDRSSPSNIRSPSLHAASMNARWSEDFSSMSMFIVDEYYLSSYRIRRQVRTEHHKLPSSVIAATTTRNWGC